MSRIDQAAVRNRLLAALPPGSFARLAGALHPISLDLRQVLQRPGEPIETACFPAAGIVSMLAPLEGGEALEVGMVGREGLVGLSFLLGAESTTTEAVVQAPGAGWWIRTTLLKEAFEQDAALRSLLLRYMQAFHAQVAQTAACNGRHVVEERLARWLLMSHDRIDGDELPTTQEFIATMLGVRRAGVTVAAGILRRAGLIGYAPGHVTILDRPGLEAASCECYRTVRQQFDRLLDLPTG